MLLEYDYEFVSSGYHLASKYTKKGTLVIETRYPGYDISSIPPAQTDPPPPLKELSTAL